MNIDTNTWLLILSSTIFALTTQLNFFLGDLILGLGRQVDVPDEGNQVGHQDPELDWHQTQVQDLRYRPDLPVGVQGGLVPSLDGGQGAVQTSTLQEKGPRFQLGCF